MEITNRVYMDIDIDDERIGRIVIGLFGHDAPATCKNFRYFCNNQPQDTYKGKEMTYKGTRVHRVIPNFIIQGGDFLNGDGSGSGSIYGSTFKDENFRIRHNEAGILTMANTGRDTNAAQFMITLQPSSWLDLKHVAFGKVVDGLDILEKIAEKGSLNGEPTANIVISGCGELPWY
uniref:Peptidyl-prolyl cis-trans isomerase n=1 Tax=Bigelowiella natans TaxID=227086 RepID=A0A6T7B1Z4_BIGNA|mmetsp:Transcript_325/g.456  ORF Transcript_325/g.456 Transcript_325/m.456 type:complete len:176 (+) Transcript_325:1-528(+)